MKRLLILGAGTGGCMIANKMRKQLPPSEWEITVIDKSRNHYYQPGLIFLPFKLYGYTDEKGNVRDTTDFIPAGVGFVEAEIQRIDHANHRVETSAGSHEYDRLVIALGCHIEPEDIPGLTDGYGKNVFYFYTYPSALDLQRAVDDFDGGRFVLDIAETPIKCPVAPIEFACLANYYFTMKGIRDRVQIAMITPMESVFTKPICSTIMGDLLRERNIEVIPNFSLAEVDSDKGTISSYDGHQEHFDMLVAIPPNVGPAVLDESGLGDGNGYCVTHPNSLQATRGEDIFVLGDCTNVATSKAGSVAHFEAGIVAENLLRSIRGEPLIDGFDGHSNCFIETGFNKAHLIDFNYTQQPVPGTLPLPMVGPFSLLKETHLNHLGKLLFRWYYWNLLLHDRLSGPMELFLPTRMSTLGKDPSYLNRKAA